MPKKNPDRLPLRATSEGFFGLGLDERLIATLTELGYEEPTPIQREAIPPLLDRPDLIGQAATGTGKTAAFALPMLQRIAGAAATTAAQPSALILVPTRELAMQVAEAMHKYGRGWASRVLPIYGGQSFGAADPRRSKRGVDVVVATPGRALDHIRRETLDLDGIADPRARRGRRDARHGLRRGPRGDPRRDAGRAADGALLRDAAAAHRGDGQAAPERPGAHPDRDGNARQGRSAEGPADGVHRPARADKLEALGRVLDLENPTSALVFCRTRNEVDELTERSPPAATAPRRCTAASRRTSARA